MLTPDEPLNESAPIFRALAEQLCSPECRDYHAFWQYFRLIGLISTIATDNDFLVDSIRSLAESGQYNKVLISATADYGMLARVIHAFRLVNRTPEITVLDQCESPLAINRWYAERHGVNIETTRVNILDYHPSEDFDLICTHSFLAMLPWDVQKLALSRWHGLLRQGGKVITSLRVHHGAGPEMVGFEEHQIQSFQDKALKLAQESQEKLDMPAETLAEGAKHYIEHRRRKRRLHRSLDEIRGLFIEAGFASIELNAIGQHRPDDNPSVPGRKNNSERVNIIAHRP